MSEFNPSPKDALGRPLAEGDGVLLTVSGPTLFRVAQIESNFADPRLPPGMMRIHFFSAAVLMVKAGAKHGEIIRVGTLADIGPMPFEMTAMDTPKEDA